MIVNDWVGSATAGYADFPYHRRSNRWINDWLCSLTGPVIDLETLLDRDTPSSLKDQSVAATR